MWSTLAVVFINTHILIAKLAGTTRGAINNLKKLKHLREIFTFTAPGDLDLCPLNIAQILYFSNHWQIAAIKSRRCVHFLQNRTPKIFRPFLELRQGSKIHWNIFGLQFWWNWKYTHRQLSIRAIRRWCLFAPTARICAMVKVFFLIQYRRTAFSLYDTENRECLFSLLVVCSSFFTFTRWRKIYLRV